MPLFVGEGQVWWNATTDVHVLAQATTKRLTNGRALFRESCGCATSPESHSKLSRSIRVPGV